MGGIASKRTILVVDDDSDIRRIVRDFLQGCGHEVVLAESGEVALETFKLYRPAVRAVLTDIMMGVMSGIDLADHLHQISPTLPIVFMSGYIQDGQLGGCTVLRKPFRLAELKQAIETALRSGQQHSDT